MTPLSGAAADIDRSATPPGDAERQRLGGLEGIRGLLALAVLAVHTWTSFLQPTLGPDHPWAAGVWRLAGEIAVACFFTLSGYVIASSIVANSRRHGRFDVRDYAAARLFRVLPPLLVTVAVTALLAGLLGATGFDRTDRPWVERSLFATDPWAQWLAIGSLATTGDLTGGINGPLWSLAWEIRLYVLTGFVAYAASRRGWARLGAAALGLGYVLLLPLGVPGVLPGALAVAFQFGLGAATALANVSRMSRGDALFAFAVVAGVTAAALGFDHRTLLNLEAGVPNLGAQAIASMWFAGLVLAMRDRRGIERLAQLGSVSYTLYILHFPLLQALYFLIDHRAPWALERPWVFATSLLASLATFVACVLVGRWVERPVLQRRRFVERIELYRRAPQSAGES